MKHSEETDTLTSMKSFGQAFQNGLKCATKLQCKQRLLALTLDDYTLPGFVSGAKHYYGSINQISVFMEQLRTRACFQGTVSAFQEYQDGDSQVEHYVAYNNQRLLQPVTVLLHSSVILGKTKWTFYNTYRFPYNMRIDSATVDVALIKEGSSYLRIIKPRVINLQYQLEPPVKRKWDNLDGGFWGHPGILLVEKEKDRFTVASSLYLSERKYESKDKAIGLFDSDPILLDGLCQDVFGDG